LTDEEAEKQVCLTKGNSGWKPEKCRTEIAYNS
jgi:hypothetical protein